MDGTHLDADGARRCRATGRECLSYSEALLRARRKNRVERTHVEPRECRSCHYWHVIHLSATWW